MHNIKHCLILSWLLCISISINAEVNKDSLDIISTEIKNKLTTNIDDSTKLQLTFKLYRAYRNSSDYTNAVATILDGIELADKLKNDKAKCNLLYNAAVLYQRLEKNELAIDYGLEALNLSTATNDSINIGASSHRLGLAYNDIGEINIARSYLKKSLEIRKILNNKYAFAASNNALGLTYMNENKGIANSYFLTALRLWKSIGNNEGISIAAGNIGDVFIQKQDTINALKYYEESYKSAKSVNSFIFLKETCFSLSEIYSALGNPAKAYHFLSEYSIANSTLFNIESKRVIEEMQSKYETEKNTQEIKHQKELIQQKEIELKQQKTMTWGAIGAGGILILLLIYSIKSYFQKKEDNEHLNVQKNTIEEKNKSITDSIAYAKLIQDAVFSNEDIDVRIMRDHFTLIKPKDVVSGDFYWKNRKDVYSYIAVADCTGHGVPGAFMSILGITLLNDILSDLGTPTPAEILDILRDRIIKELNQSDSTMNKDGMDISIARINNNTLDLEWAGANNPLWILRNNEITAIKPDAQPIGHYLKMKPFTNHHFKLILGDMIYLFSDGFADQFGGKKEKKLKYKPFKELLLSSTQTTMKEQAEHLEMFFNDWKGNLEQIDDVCIIGLRI
jgi:serine phosphatase RsbU (regulator of sigma subunit)